MFPSILHDAKGPLIHLSCVLGTPPLVISLRPCLSCGEAAAAPFYRECRGFLFNKKKSWRFWMRCFRDVGTLRAASPHKHKQPPSIFLWIAQKKERETKRNNSNTTKISSYWTIHFFSPLSLWIRALTKYSTLRIVHIGRTEEGGKTCGPGFPSQVSTLEATTEKKG